MRYKGIKKQAGTNYFLQIIHLQHKILNKTGINLIKKTVRSLTQ